MKVRVNIEKKMSLTMEIPEGSEYRFMEKILQHARIVSKVHPFDLRGALEDPLVFAHPATEESTYDYDTETEQENTEDTAESVPAEEYPEAPHAYKGFLYIKCRHCGAEKGFNAKKPLTGYVCTECGEITELDALEPLRVQCECGGDFRYMTNIDADMFDVECLRCSAPVSVIHNKKKHMYTTIKEQE